VSSAARTELVKGPVVIQARGVDKTFRIPHQRLDSLKERVIHVGRPRTYRELRALQGIDFEVHLGEFFGIVGRNGSGKSTLLKIMASIYKADAGRVRMAGRMAPFIELGVGFNPEMTSRDNVVLNGVLMGLTRQEARRRLDSVLDFAELQEFADLKLKNYSSGMMVRLAFSVMVEADADIMLIDEVLAVGDAAFAQKCVDIFRARRDAGKTVVLVTHDMATVQSFCDRAMLIHDGELTYIGDPDEASLRYYRLNFQGEGGGPTIGDVPDVNVRLIDVWLSNAAGERVENLEQGEPFGLNMIVEARRELVRPMFGFYFLTAAGFTVFGFTLELEREQDEPDVVAAGERVRISGQVENPLLPGRYTVTTIISRNRSLGDLALHLLRVLDFVVFGTEPGAGSVTVANDLTAVIEQ
jgi:ABC-type polysaccharide/polyol phosphate transport system ATPase subunit